MQVFKFKSAKNAQTVKPIGKVDGTDLGQHSHKLYAMLKALSERLEPTLSEDDADLLHMIRNESYYIDNVLRGYQINPNGE